MNATHRAVRRPAGTLRRPWSRLPGLLVSRYRRRETAALRVSVGLLYLWFGVLKFLPGMSPAQDIATRAMGVMTFDTVPAAVSQPLLAAMEVLIGLGLVIGRLLPLTLGVFFVHMAGVFATLVILPGEVWKYPLVPSMEGQYILKNLVLVAACLSVATATARSTEPRNETRAASRGEALTREPAQPEQPREVIRAG
ncbi:DoxX family protein [Streptomyces sp. H27-S2]|uniref:DoxX family protein n=1 Tax=Streptomyces antarcticus TaxID=2996458 RepID=UPI00226DC23F|nr:DoxX family protein [Streptomyces sp. H27-S2]MCY0949941.1 DoxX family protein [Streptomyces sp. H27-S2]